MCQLEPVWSVLLGAFEKCATRGLKGVPFGGHIECAVGGTRECAVGGTRECAIRGTESVHWRHKEYAARGHEGVCR